MTKYLEEGFRLSPASQREALKKLQQRVGGAGRFFVHTENAVEKGKSADPHFDPKTYGTPGGYKSPPRKGPYHIVSRTSSDGKEIHHVAHEASDGEITLHQIENPSPTPEEIANIKGLVKKNRGTKKVAEGYEEDFEDDFEDLEEEQIDEVSIGKAEDANALRRKKAIMATNPEEKEKHEKKAAASGARIVNKYFKESAVDTLKPNSNPTNLDSKTGLMAAAMAAIGGMSKEDLSHFLNDALAQIGQEAANIDGGAAAKNAATIQMKPSAAGSAVKEDLDELFGEDLSEEFKDQASTLFEAAVQARIIVETAALEEAYEEALNEHMEEITASLVEKVDDYLTYVAEQWVAENEVAIESALKVEVMEDFVNGLKDLFVENYIEIPSGKTDVLEDLVLTVEELEEKLNSVLSENIELKKELNEKVIDDTFETVAEGLAATQIEKLRTLSEGVDYNSVEDYKKKLTLIRGKLVENKRVSTNIITEEAPAHDSEFEDAPRSGFIDSDVRNYVSAISRTVKK